MTYKPNSKLLIGVPILMVLAFATTFSLLYFFVPKSDAPATTDAVATKPSEIIKKVQEPGAVSQLLNLYTLQKDVPAGLTTINYTKENSYTTYVSATDSAQFSQKDTATSKNSTVVKDSIATFLSTNGLKKVAVAEQNSFFTLFDSDQTTCQLIDLPANGTGSILTLGCIEKSTINNQFSTIDAHLELYKSEKARPAVTPLSIRISTIKEANKTLDTLNVYNVNGSAVTLLFAAIDKDWKYIGSQVLSMDAGDGKTTIDRTFSNELKANINDAKYKGFLKKYIQ